jgi:hypothetical protein
MSTHPLQQHKGSDLDGRAAVLLVVLLQPKASKNGLLEEEQGEKPGKVEGATTYPSQPVIEVRRLT